MKVKKIKLINKENEIEVGIGEFPNNALKLCASKDSYSTANEGKRQFNRSIIYYLNIVSIVNDSFWQFL